MIQTMGIVMILIGAIMWHIASSNEAPKNIPDIWRDFLKVLEGKSLA